MGWRRRARIRSIIVPEGNVARSVAIATTMRLRRTSAMEVIIVSNDFWLLIASLLSLIFVCLLFRLTSRRRPSVS